MIVSKFYTYMYILYSPQTSAAIKYLEFCVNKLQSNVTSVHNFLVCSYANSSSKSDHDKLLKYVENQDQVSSHVW